MIEARLPQSGKLGPGKHTQTSQRVDTIDVHRTASADALSATPSEGKGRINLILNPNQGIQHHRSCLIQIQRIALHAWLRGWLIGIPAVDMERLDFCLRTWNRLFDSACLGGRYCTTCRAARYGCETAECD